MKDIQLSIDSIGIGEHTSLVLHPARPCTSRLALDKLATSMAARTGAAVLFMALVVCAGLVATPAEARGAPDLYTAAMNNAASSAATATAGGGIRRGRWNMARRLEGGDAAHKREVPGGPDPQHHH
jgi:hypothetical protein